MARGDSGFRGDNVTAATTNVAQCMRAMEKAVSRPGHLPGLVGFYGPSGYGKSMAAAYTQQQYRCYYLECRDSWTKKAFLENLLKEMHVKAEKTIAKMVDQAAEQLALAQNMAPRPLILDEADKPVDRGYIETVRDIYEGSGGAPMLLIGEEKLETKLRAYERFHNRVLDWVPAQPASMDDVRQLLRMYGGGVAIADDLLKRVHEVSRGVTRRICVNLSRIAEQAQLELDGGAADLAWWGGRELFTGEARRGL